MGASKIIKHVLLERNITAKSLTDKLGIETQSMNNKLYRDTFSFKEVLKIADILGCDVKIVMRDTGKEFWDRLTQAEDRPKNRQKQSKAVKSGPSAEMEYTPDTPAK